MLHLLGCRAASTVTFLGRDYQDYNHSDRKWKVLCCSWSKLTDNSVVAGRNQSVSLEMEPRRSGGWQTSRFDWQSVEPQLTQFNIVRSTCSNLCFIWRLTVNLYPAGVCRGQFGQEIIFLWFVFVMMVGGGGGGGCTCNQWKCPLFSIHHYQ